MDGGTFGGEILTTLSVITSPGFEKLSQELAIPATDHWLLAIPHKSGPGAKSELGSCKIERIPIIGRIIL